MGREDLDKLAERLASIHRDVRDAQKRIDAAGARAKALKPEILAHFNDWTFRELNSLVPYSIKEATRADYSGQGTFVIYMGEIHENGRIITWDSSVYHAVQKYIVNAPWVKEVKTGFQKPR